MYTSIVLLVSLAVSLAAPAEDSRAYYFTRSKKSPSGYGAPPCHSEGNLAPIALFLTPQQSAGHYRSEDEGKPSESHHHPEARSYYDSGSALSSLASAASGQAAIGAPAIGVFPNANLGGCAIPLLLSCSPSIVKGHIVKHASAAPAYGAPAAVPSYREGGQNSEVKEHAAPMTPKAWENERASGSQADHMMSPMHERHHLMVPVDHHQHHHMVNELQNHA